MSKFQSFNFGFHETYSKTTSDVSYGKHMHNYYELYFFLEGDADYVIGNTVYHLQHNDLLIIRPSVYHYLKLLSDNPYHRVVCNFTAEHLIKDSLIESISNINNLQTHYKVPADSLISQYYKNCISIIDRYDERDAYYCLVQHLNLIIAELKYRDEYACDSTSAKTIHPIFSRIISFIDENINIPLNVSVLSKQFFVSTSWIMHSFRKYLNISANEYINRKKILYAQKLIADGISPTRAAETCGYQNYSTFFAQYKNIIGYPPNKTKQSMLNI